MKTYPNSTVDLVVENPLLSIEKERIRSELKALRAQMNPHFIFNGLNSIHSTLELGEIEKASSLLLKLSKMMRKTLAHSRAESIPLSEEISFLSDYLEFESQKSNHRFTYSIEVDQDLKNSNPNLPPTMIQTLCENAVKYAFQEENDQNHIQVQITKTTESNHLIAVVADNGVGISHLNEIDFAQSYGLSIIQERISLMNERGESASLKIEYNTPEHLNKGTKVCLTLPTRLTLSNDVQQ